MILATVGDGWGPDASRNRQDCAPAGLLPLPTCVLRSPSHVGCPPSYSAASLLRNIFPCRWMDDPALAASFDLVVVYFGNSSGFACPQCLHVFRRPRATK